MILRSASGGVEPDGKIGDHGSEVLIALWGFALNELLDVRAGCLGRCRVSF